MAVPRASIYFSRAIPEGPFRKAMLRGGKAKNLRRLYPLCARGRVYNIHDNYHAVNL